MVKVFEFKQDTPSGVEEGIRIETDKNKIISVSVWCPDMGLTVEMPIEKLSEMAKAFVVLQQEIDGCQHDFMLEEQFPANAGNTCQRRWRCRKCLEIGMTND